MRTICAGHQTHTFHRNPSHHDFKRLGDQQTNHQICHMIYGHRLTFSKDKTQIFSFKIRSFFYSVYLCSDFLFLRRLKYSKN